MSRYVVTWERPFERVQDRDAYAVGLVVERDGQHLGLWTATLSGIAMRIGSTASLGRYWSALAVHGAEGVKAAIFEERPSGWQVDAHPVAVDASEVQRLAESNEVLPAGPSDNPLVTFEAE